MALILPDAAGVIFGARDNRVAFVVESAAENFVFVALSRVSAKALDLVARLSGPKAASLVAGSRNNHVARRVKLNFSDLVFVTLQDRRAGPRKNVVNARHAIGTRRRQLVARLVEARIQHLVVVASELLDTLACAHVPQTSGPVDGSCQAVVSCKVELAARELRSVAAQGEQTLSSAHVPDFCRVIERSSHELVAVSVEVETDDLGVMAFEAEDFVAGLNVPQLGRVVHRTRGHEHAMRVEGKTDDLHLVSLQVVIALTRIRIPNFCFPVKGARHDFVAINPQSVSISVEGTYPYGLLKAMV